MASKPGNLPPAESELYKVKVKIAAQVAYCKKNNLEAVISHNGFCWNKECTRQIMDAFTVEQSGLEHIAICPYCYRALGD